MKFSYRKKAFTLIEMMVTVTIISILAVIGYRGSMIALRKSTLVSQAVAIKGSILQARTRSIEKTVQVQVDLAGGNLLALADLDRGGFFGEDFSGATDQNELVIGEAVDEGSDFTIKNVKVIPVTDPDLGSASIPHPSGAYSITPSASMGYSTFEDDKFIILPSGLIVSPANTSTPISGSIFLKTNDGEMLGLIHVTALGEVRVAIKELSDTEWVWQ